MWEEPEMVVNITNLRNSSRYLLQERSVSNAELQVHGHNCGVLLGPLSVSERIWNVRCTIANREIFILHNSVMPKADHSVKYGLLHDEDLKVKLSERSTNLHYLGRAGMRI